METSKQIGTRVILNTLLKPGNFPGKIIEVEEHSGLCVVKLDSQDAPVSGVLWFDEVPDVVKSALCQICYPEDE